MCKANDKLRAQYDTTIDEYDEKKTDYEKEKNDNSNVRSVLECTKGKMAALSSNLDNVRISGGESYDNGAKFDMNCSEAIGKIDTVITERKNRISEIDTNIEALESLIKDCEDARDALPTDCGSCEECCPPTLEEEDTSMTSKSGGR